MKKILMTSVLLIATGCTTLSSTQDTAAKDATSKEENILKARQHAVLQALGGTEAK